MARFIKPIPTLTGAAAERFWRIREENEKNRGCDFDPEKYKEFKEIMREYKLRNLNL